MEREDGKGTNQGAVNLPREIDLPKIEDLRQRVESLELELERAKQLAEGYRLAAKSRAEEVSRLILRPQSTTDANKERELRRLRALEARYAVRFVVAGLKPFERRYQAMKPGLRRLIRRGSRA